MYPVLLISVGVLEPALLLITAGVLEHALLLAGPTTAGLDFNPLTPLLPKPGLNPAGPATP